MRFAADLAAPAAAAAAAAYLLQHWPWDDPTLDPMARAFRTMHANFELMDKLGVTHWCFHDR